jgi:hypothetical protein
MKRYLRLAFLPFVFLCLFACEKPEGSQMVGKWVGTKTTSHILVITRQGAKFVIDEDLESSNGEKLPHHEFVATYQNGTLFFKHPVSSQPMQITYLKDFDFLNFDGQTFKRTS